MHASWHITSLYKQMSRNVLSSQSPINLSKNYFNSDAFYISIGSVLVTCLLLNLLIGTNTLNFNNEDALSYIYLGVSILLLFVILYGTATTRNTKQHIPTNVIVGSGVLAFLFFLGMGVAAQQDAFNATNSKNRDWLVILNFAAAFINGIVFLALNQE